MRTSATYTISLYLLHAAAQLPVINSAVKPLFAPYSCARERARALELKLDFGKVCFLLILYFLLDIKKYTRVIARG